MSDLPEPSDDVKAFFAEHQATGEPSVAALARVRARVRWAAAKPVAPPAKRSWLRHEVMAAAAVLLVMVGVQGLYVALRNPSAAAPAVPATDEGGEVKAVIAAYQAGDVAQAQRLASKGGPACAPLVSKLAQVVVLSARLDALSADELARLAALDVELARGGQTALGQKLAQLRKTSPTMEPSQTGAEALYVQALEASRSWRPSIPPQQYERAIRLLEQCQREYPSYANCYKLLGSVWAKVSSRDSSEDALRKARAYYERFLELAPPDDDAVPKVRAILGMTHENEPFGAAPQPKAMTEKEETIKVAYLRGSILREASPDEAARLFQTVLELTDPSDSYHLKARAQLARLRAAPAPPPSSSEP